MGHYPNPADMLVAPHYLDGLLALLLAEDEFTVHHARDAVVIGDIMTFGSFQSSLAHGRMASAHATTGKHNNQSVPCSYVVSDGVHIHDFHATMLHLLGIDHERLTYKFQGRRYRLTDVHGKLVKGLLA